MLTLSHDDLTQDLAYLAENDVILEAINRTLESTPNEITLRYNCKVKKYELPNTRTSHTANSTWAEVHFEDGDVIETRLLVSRLIWLIFQACIT